MPNKDIKPILLGGIGEKNFGKQFRQGNRVYDLNSIAMCLMAQPIGNLGGHSYLYSKQNKLKGEDNGMKIFNNDDLKQYKFNMQPIKLFDSFAGIGALHQALNELGVPVELTGISEIDVDAIISYGCVHNLIDKEFEYPSDDEMREWLIARNIGYDFKTKKSKIPRLKKDKLKQCYKVSILANNYGDISIIDYDKIKDFGLFNMSFPCVDISISGKQEGMVDKDGNKTRSGLYVDGIKLIKTNKPKYIMIENVKNLISKKFIDSFYNIVNEIEGLGYKCYYPIKKDKPYCLNAKDFGIPQNRERIIVICIRNDVDNGYKFPNGFELKMRLKDLLEDSVNKKYYLSKEIQSRFKLTDETFTKNIVGTTIGEKCTRIGQKDSVYQQDSVIGTLISTDYKQPKQILETDRLIKIEGKQTVKIRKHDVDTDKLKELLKQAKSIKKLTNKEISELLGQSLTTVEHWFRNDKCFSIPDKDIWERLKQVLGITTTEFDESITTFIEMEGVYEKSNRIYLTNGIAPTITSSSNDNILEVNNNKSNQATIEVVGNYSPSGHDASRIVSSNGIAPTVKENHGTVTATVVQNKCVLIPENTKRGYKECELNGVANLSYSNSETRRGLVQENGTVRPTITSEGNGLCRIEPKERFFKQAFETFENNLCKYGDTIDAFNERVNKSGCCPALTTRPEGFKTAVLPVTNDYRIRKLTPKECWRLMGFKDCLIDKCIENNISDSQLYKQAGNSIVVNMLYYVFYELFKDNIIN